MALAERVRPETACWAAIRQTGRPLAIEARDIAHLAPLAQRLAGDAPFERHGEGPVDRAVAALGELPAPLRADIGSLASRFADLMNVAEIRIRLEGITSNACRKIHADYTDVRLITAYAGPGTEYIPAGAPAEERSLVRIPTGWIALFKGRTYGEGHACCLHRSPPVEGTGQKRVVLVIDTPLDESRMPAPVRPAAAC